MVHLRKYWQHWAISGISFGSLYYSGVPFFFIDLRGKVLEVFGKLPDDFEGFEAENNVFVTLIPFELIAFLRTILCLRVSGVFIIV